MKEQRKGQSIRSREPAQGKRKKATSICYMMPFRNVSNYIDIFILHTFVSFIFNIYILYLNI